MVMGQPVLNDHRVHVYPNRSTLMFHRGAIHFVEESVNPIRAVVTFFFVFVGVILTGALSVAITVGLFHLWAWVMNTLEIRSNVADFMLVLIVVVMFSVYQTYTILRKRK